MQKDMNDLTISKQTVWLVLLTVFVMLVFALALPALAQDYDEMDIEDILDEISTEDELQLYEDHPDYAELEELFYERQKEEEDND